MLPPEGFADQISGAQRNEERTSGMFFHLLLDSRLQLLDVRFTQPVSARLHSGGESVGDRGDARVVGDGNRSGRCGFARCAILSQRFGARFEAVGNDGWETRGFVLYR